MKIVDFIKIDFFYVILILISFYIDFYGFIVYNYVYVEFLYVIYRFEKLSFKVYEVCNNYDVCWILNRF